MEQLRKGQAPITEVSDYSYSQYNTLVQREQEPELLITLPDHGSAAAAQQHAAGAAEAVTPSIKVEQPSTSQLQEQQQGSVATDPGASTPPKPQPVATSSQQTTTPPAHGANGSQHTSKQPQRSGGSSQQIKQERPVTGTGGRPAASTAGATAAAAAPLGTPVTLTIHFSKACTDSSLVFANGWLVADPRLRRSRGWFPCVDCPVYTYVQNMPHYMPHTFDLRLTVGPDQMAVCSGTLVQHSLNVGVSAPDGTSRGLSRTFHYAITVPCVPAHIAMAVGTFDTHPAAALFDGVGNGTAAAANGVVITGFAPSGTSLGVLRATLRPLQLIVKVCEKALACRFPFPYLQVAVVPAEATDEPLLVRDRCSLALVVEVPVLCQFHVVSKSRSLESSLALWYGGPCQNACSEQGATCRAARGCMSMTLRIIVVAMCRWAWAACW